MQYDVFILRRAQKELASLPESNYERSRNAIAALSTNPRPTGCKKLSAGEGWRILQVTIGSSIKLMIVKGESRSCM
jgi:mRNA interferase RelE/StbE